MTDKRNIYLKMETLADARRILLDAFPAGNRLAEETVPVTDAVGRVLSRPVFAKLSSPNFHAAAMDGIAVAAETTFGAAESSPKTLIMGEDAHYVNTGHVMPQNTNAVIMIEHVNVMDERRVEIEAPAFPWQHVRRMGEDIVATELVFPRNRKISPPDLGALITAGIFEISVWKKPLFFIQPTGSELVDLRDASSGLAPGQVIDSNSHMLGALAASCGGRFIRNPIIRDELETITAAVREAAIGESDILFLIGGSSAGSMDYSKKVIETLGEVLVHGVTMMPGKPVIIGRINGKPAFGIPGYPVSAIIAFDQLIRPLMNALLHQPDPPEESALVVPVKKLPSKLGLEEFLRVKLGAVNDTLVATPLPRGAGCITSFTEADGIIRIPNHMEGLPENQPFPATLLRPLHEIQNTIVVVGSHDNTIDVLADLIRAESSRVSISSSHVGSMGGLMAIKKGLCHVAGTHLLDPEEGSYNISYLKKYLPDTPIHLVHLVQREQGLIIRPGNPKKIQGIEDLTRKDLTFINRQGGSGTRILLDFKLDRLGLSKADITGYENEEFTHMAVAVAVLSGAADAGLGIYAAAKALGLDFIPVITESYDLIIPDAFFYKEKIKILLSVIRSGAFIEKVNELGGYHTDHTGEVIWKSQG